MIDKKSLWNKKARTSFLEIFLLIISIFAFAYIIYSTFEEIKIVSAKDEDNPLYCCPETNSGVICQDVASDFNNCKEGVLPTKCEEVSSCKIGCCFDETKGFCSPQSPKQRCETEGGKWTEKPNCEVIECRKGCCVLGSNTEFITEKSCEYLTRLNQPNQTLIFDFRQNTNEIECKIIEKSQKQGACIIETTNQEDDENGCIFTTELGCLQQTGNSSRFHENILCTNPDLNTICKKTENIGCIEGKDEVYLLDSCGNTANIYDIDKVDNDNYWEEVVEKQNSCGAESGNIDSDSCGNCKYDLGSRCSVKNNKPICIDLNCNNAPDVVDAFGNILKTQDRKNGESWCVYDGEVNNGKDIIGSRHFRYYCLDGETKVEPCSDFRQEVCGKIEIENSPVNESDVIEKAESIDCVANRWKECVDITNKVYSEIGEDEKAMKEFFKNVEENKTTEFKENCEAIDQCEYYEMNLSKTPIIPICKPRFPPGLNFWDNSSSSKDTCNFVTNIPYIGACVRIVNTCEGCVSGCDCGTEKWLEEVNKIAASFGDCGAYVNIAGQVTEEGYEATKGKNDSKKGEIPIEARLNQSYLDSLKKYQENITEESVKIYYDNFTNPHIPFTLDIKDFAWVGGGINSGGGIGVIGRGFIIVKMLKIVPWLWMVLEITGVLSRDCSTKKIYYNYYALPYQAPVGGKDCEKINLIGEASELKPSSEYRCKSLGTACEYLNEGTGDETCEWINKDDDKSPVLSVWEEILPEGSNYEQIACSSSSGCYELKSTETDSCIKPYTPYSLGVLSDEPSQCKIDYNHTDSFENMSSWLGTNSYTREHQNNISLISPGHIYEALGIEISNEQDFYIRCRDVNGNENSQELTINLCVDAGPDNNEPIILRTIPKNNAYVYYGINETGFFISLNEPAECKYSNEDKNYSDMENTMSCPTNLEEVESDFTYLCNSTLDLSPDNSTFYIKCKDQPWLTEENDTRRNINSESYVYNLIKSESILGIETIEPEGTKIFGVEPSPITLKVKTIGGAEYGKAKCSWEFINNGWKDDFFNTDSTIHTSVLSTMYSGDYDLKVKCIDIAGNEAEKQTDFRIKIDKTSPKVVRVYQSGGSLKIMTDEESECAYSNKNCYFVFENATMMSGTMQEHSTGLDFDYTYYIKCQDLWENKPGGCSIIVKPVDLE